MIVVIQAHPYPDHSRANRALARAIDDMDGVAVRSLYDRYPDFSIDVAAEQRALAAADAVVWQHPLFWYSAPALLKLWFEKVLAPGWAYGPGGDALRAKPCQWVVTTGGEERDYSRGGLHGHEFDTFTAAMRQTALFCGMVWREPFVVHDALRLDAAQLESFAARYRALLAQLGSQEVAADA